MNKRLPIKIKLALKFSASSFFAPLNLILNEDIKDIEKKVQEKKNEIIYLKNKIKISEKNKIQKNEILEKNKKENDKLNEEIIRYLEMQIGSNKEKLEDQNSKIE